MFFEATKVQVWSRMILVVPFQGRIRGRQNNAARLRVPEDRIAWQVIFKGEEGIDEGGVQKEFFQLIVRQMFDLNYGEDSFSWLSGRCST